MMYQAWGVQKFNGVLHNVMLGEHYPTIDEAYRTICLYEEHFGKCEHWTIEEAGTEIPLATVKRETLKEKILSWFRQKGADLYDDKRIGRLCTGTWSFRL